MEALFYIPREQSKDMMKTIFNSRSMTAVDGLVAEVTQSIEVT